MSKADAFEFYQKLGMVVKNADYKLITFSTAQAQEFSDRYYACHKDYWDDLTLLEPPGGVFVVTPSEPEVVPAASKGIIIVVKGDIMGHEFHGNQFTAGPHNDAPNAKAQTPCMSAEELSGLQDWTMDVSERDEEQTTDEFVDANRKKPCRVNRMPTRMITCITRHLPIGYRVSSKRNYSRWSRR